MRTPYVGAVVLFAPRGWQLSLWGTTEARAAIVGHVHDASCVDVGVIVPSVSPPVVSEIRVRFDADGAPGTWRWPDAPT